MNTRNAYNIRARQTSGNSSGHNVRAKPAARVGLAVPKTVNKNPYKLAGHSTSRTKTSLSSGQHPLTDGYNNARLAHCEDAIKGRFESIEETLRLIASIPNGEGFKEKAQHIAARGLGFSLPEKALDNAWISGPDMKAIYAYCTFSALKASAAKFVDDLNNQVEVVQDTKNFFLDCGFHAVDISPCADGRLKGLTRYILRLPLSSFSRRKAYAGALFDIETDVRHWTNTELKRYREGVPTTPDSGSRYLKIAVYHYSTSDASHQGCAAHGSNENKAIDAALERLEQFREAIENAFCCGASTDILLIGVDTDNDSIRVHIPDAMGNITAFRKVDNADIYTATKGGSANDARLAIYEAISRVCQEPEWGAGEGEPHEGMRKLIANLLINNLSQIEYVNEIYDGIYPDIGHAERYISVGDGFEEVQMRNIAYYAHMHTLEEGVADMDVGIKIFTGLNVKRGLPIPVAIHYRYDARVPGSKERTIAKAQRVRDAIKERYSDLDEKGLLFCHLSVQDLPTGSAIETVENGL
jgi:carboxysome shell carbonic anhydrase